MNAYTGPFGGVLVFRGMGGGPVAIRKRHAGPCGPYYAAGVRRAETADGIGGYLTQEAGAFGALALGEGGGVRLRVKDANEWQIGRLRQTLGYWADADGAGDSVRPFVALLPHGRGYLAGWGFGPGMACGFSRDIYATAEDAARAAHHEAERVAEDAREDEERARYDEAQREEDERKAAAAAAREARRARAYRRRMRAARREVSRALRVAVRLQADWTRAEDCRRGRAIVDAIRKRFQTLPAFMGGPWANHSRGWAAEALNDAAAMRRAYASDRWSWRVTHHAGRIAHARSLVGPRHEYRGIPK